METAYSTSFENPAVFACRQARNKCGNFKTGWWLRWSHPLIKNKKSLIEIIPAMSMPDLCKNSTFFNAYIATTKQDKCKHMIRWPVRSNNCMMTSFFPLSLLKANQSLVFRDYCSTDSGLPGGFCPKNGKLSQNPYAAIWPFLQSTNLNLDENCPSDSILRHFGGFG